jgi:hypothetical protein
MILRNPNLAGLVWTCFRYGKAFVPAVLASAGALGIGLCARPVGFANGSMANTALGTGLCVIAYALCVPVFLRIRQTI